MNITIIKDHSAILSTLSSIQDLVSKDIVDMQPTIVALQEFTKYKLKKEETKEQKLLLRRHDASDEIKKNIDLELFRINEKKKKIIQTSFKKEAKLYEKMDWHRQIIIAVPNQVVGTNLSLSSETVLCRRDVDQRTKTYWELGCDQRDGETVLNSNAYGASGKIVKRRAKYYFFPFQPSAEILSVLSQTFDEESSIFILNSNLTCVGATVVESTQNNNFDYKTAKINSIKDITRDDSLYVFSSTMIANSFANTILNRDYFIAGDKVTVLCRDFSTQNCFINAGSLAYFNNTDNAGCISVKLVEKGRNFNLGRTGKIQHSFVRTIENVRGLALSTKISVVGTHDVVECLAKMLKNMGFFNVTLIELA